MSPEEELADMLKTEMENAYPEGGSPPPPLDEEVMKNYLATATAIVKFMRSRGFPYV
jgi:hypothetical protein